MFLVTIEFEPMPGPKQLTTVTVRIDTPAWADAAVQAQAWIETITTVPIERVVIRYATTNA